MKPHILNKLGISKDDFFMGLAGLISFFVLVVLVGFTFDACNRSSEVRHQEDIKDKQACYECCRSIGSNKVEWYSGYCECSVEGAVNVIVTPPYTKQKCEKYY